MWIDAAADRDTDSAGLTVLPAFPDEDTQRITNNEAGAKTMRAAVSFYRVVDEEVDRHFDVSSQELSCLDYGAGWGRITRLLLRTFIPANLTAADVDDRLVTAGSDLLRGVDFDLIESGQPLPYDDDTFDVIVANSVFSHLSPDLHAHDTEGIGSCAVPRGLAASHHAWSPTFAEAAGRPAHA